MQTKRDQVQAHNFVVGRLRSALLQGDADAMETPTRRFSVAAFAGVIVAALIVAGCGAFGFFFPGGNTTWREPGTIIVEKDSGAQYVYDATNDVLRPTLNHASALLLTGPDATVRSVSSSSLEGVRHGLPIGIEGAPDSLPGLAQLSRDPWLVCASSTTDVSGEARPVVTLVVGHAATASVIPTAVLVATASGSQYLIWNDHRLRIADPAASVALGLDQTRPLPVADAWLNGLPAGPDVRPPRIPGQGGTGPTVDGRSTRVGQVLRVSGAEGDTADFRLVLADGLASLTPTLAALVLADPHSQAAYDGSSPQAIPVSAASIVAAQKSATTVDATGLPARPPALFDPVELGQRVLCARAVFGSASGLDLVSADVARLPAAIAPEGALDPRSANRVVVAGGTGVLARPETGPGRPGSAMWLITDVGLRFPMSTDAVTALGYGGVAPVDVPATLLALVPSGPLLDPAAAARTAPLGSRPS